MTTLLNRGFRLLNRCTETVAAESVRYLRGALVISDALPATLSNQQIEQVTSADSVVVGRQFTWRLKRSDLQIDGAEQKPQRDDRIEWVHCGKTYVFKVLPELGLPEAGAVDPRSDWVPASVKLDSVSDE